jgi:hypothetical protein
MNRSAPTVPSSADELIAFARALHGILTPFVAHGTTLLPDSVRARGSDGALHAIAPAGDVWQQQSANEFLRGIAATEVQFDLADTGVLDEVRHALFPQDKGHLRAELVALDLQEPGARVEPKLPKCDATLVLCLPSRFFGGEFVAAHRGSIELFRWGSEIEGDPDPHKLRWAAVLGAAKHQVERVRQGFRVALVYALHREKPAPERAVDEKTHTDSIRVALQGLRAALDAGTVFAVPCEGVYSSVERFYNPAGSNELEPRDDALLVGRDARLAAAAHAQGLRVRLQPYVLDTRTGDVFRAEKFVEPKRAPLASDDRKRALSLLTAKLPALAADAPTEEQFVIDPPKFTGIPKRYELDARAPKALFDGLPAIEPAPIAGVVRADCAAAALYVYSALWIDGVGAFDRASASKPTKSKPEPKSSAAEPKTVAKTTAKPPKKTPAKPAAKSTDKPADKAASKKKVTADKAIGDFKKGIAEVLARMEARHKPGAKKRG